MLSKDDRYELDRLLLARPLLAQKKRSKFAAGAYSSSYITGAHDGERIDADKAFENNNKGIAKILSPYIHKCRALNMSWKSISNRLGISQHILDVTRKYI